MQKKYHIIFHPPKSCYPKPAKEKPQRHLSHHSRCVSRHAGLRRTGMGLVAVDSDNEADALFPSCPEGQSVYYDRSGSRCVTIPNPCPAGQMFVTGFNGSACVLRATTTTTTTALEIGCWGSWCDPTTTTTTTTSTTTTTTTTTAPSSTPTTRAPFDPDPPFEPADIQRAYAQRMATQPTGVCGVAGQNSQYATYYAELATNWCSVVKIFTPTSFTDYLRLDINITGLNQTGSLTTAQLLNTVGTGALSMRIRRGTSTITCTAPGTGWSNDYIVSSRQIWLGRVFRCQSYITPATSITINTIAKTATTTTPTTRVPSDPDPPFEPADIQRAYALRTATQPTGACDVASLNSQYVTYYAELTANWCSVVMVYTPTTGSNRLRLAMNIIGKNQTGTIPREQLLKTVAAGAVTMRIQRGTSEITCTASGEGWSNAYFSDPRHIYLGRVFDCQSDITQSDITSADITPAISITINTIAKTPTTTTQQGDN